MSKQSNSMAKRRGSTAGKPRTYSMWEWARGYIAFVLLIPLYLALWLFATVCPRLPERVRKSLLRSHARTTLSRKQDVRIPTEGPVAYMLRWWKTPRNWAFNVYYHIVLRSDEDAALHDHPWWNFSIVLEGGYFEHRILPGGTHEKKWYGPGSVRFRPHGGFSHRLELKSREESTGEVLRHKTNPAMDQRPTRIVELPVKTIFVTGPVLRRWGFHDPKNGWVDAHDWDDHTELHGIKSSRMSGYSDQLTGSD